MNKKYGLLRFAFDIMFGLVTGGLWWIYLAFRFLRK